MLQTGPYFCRSLEEVELNLGGICLHVYPHQIHILSEIAGAVSVMADPTAQHHAVLKHAYFREKVTKDCTVGNTHNINAYSSFGLVHLPQGSIAS